MQTTVILNGQPIQTEYQGMNAGRIYTSDFVGAIYDKKIFGNNIICECEGATVVVITMNSKEWGENISAIMDSPVTLGY